MKKIILIIAMVAVLSACSEDQTVEQQLTDTLADVNEKEKQGISYVKKLNQQELKEQKRFTNTMELTQEQYPEVKKQVASLKKSARERTIIIEKEEKALSEAREAADKLSALIDIVDKAEKETLEKLIQALEERFEKHEQLISDYKKLIDAQTQLYTQLEDREIRSSQLQKQVKEVNILTSGLQQKIDEFNKSTNEVNRLQTRAFGSLEKAK